MRCLTNHSSAPSCRLDIGSARRSAKVEFLFRNATTDGPQRHRRRLPMKTRGGWRETPQIHEVAFKPVSEVTDAEFEALIGRFDRRPSPMIEWKPA
jgi:hypothetical protein